MELTRAFLLWNAERKRRRMSIEERVRQTQKLMFKLISLWGIDAALGWETSATDKALADTLPSVKPGEYERVNGLSEKNHIRRHRARAVRSVRSICSCSGFGKKCEEKLENAP